MNYFDLVLSTTGNGKTLVMCVCANNILQNKQTKVLYVNPDGDSNIFEKIAIYFEDIKYIKDRIDIVDTNSLLKVQELTKKTKYHAVIFDQIELCLQNTDKSEENFEILKTILSNSYILACAQISRQASGNKLPLYKRMSKNIEKVDEELVTDAYVLEKKDNILELFGFDETAEEVTVNRWEIKTKNSPRTNKETPYLVEID